MCYVGCILIWKDHNFDDELLHDAAEIAIVSTDLAELLGSAIALTLIFPKLPLWAGVILTSLDVLVILALNDGNKGRPVRLFEGIIIILVCAFPAYPSSFDSKTMVSRFSLS